MPCTANGLYVVQGEMAILLAAMRRGNRWSSHSLQDLSQDVLVQSFIDLKDVLNQIRDLKDLDPNHYFDPFLEVIRAGETTGPITSLALSSVHKFLSYGLIEATNKSVPGTLENIADAVTHAKFVSIDENSDGVVLMKILQVLRTLVLSPVGSMLSNESMCEIMLSCFRICFEQRLTEHLRRSAEFCLKDLVQHLFSQLSEFSEDSRHSNQIRKLKMNKGSVDSSSSKVKRKSKSVLQKKNKDQTETPPMLTKPETPEEPRTRTSDKVLDMQGDIHQAYRSPSDLGSTEGTAIASTESKTTKEDVMSVEDSRIETPSCVIDVDPSEDSPRTSASRENSVESREPSVDEGIVVPSAPTEDPEKSRNQDYVNPQGVRFTSGTDDLESEVHGKLHPYGLGCIRELFRFLVSLCNPSDKHNTEAMIRLGLTLLGVAFEVGADAIGNHASLLEMVKDELCRNLFSLLHVERISIFALDIQVSFLLFEALRTHLKFQLEFYLTKLTEMIVTDSSKVTYEQKEIALESVVQLWRIPGLVTELYLNYDCDLYCPNLFEDSTKLLSKNAFPVSGIYNTHLLSLDALLTVIDSIERHCHSRIVYEKQADGEGVTSLNSAAFEAVTGARMSRQKPSENVPSHEELMAVKRKKKLLTAGTEQFNSKPKKGIQFLQEHGLLSTPLDSLEVVHFLRENPRLDKKMIGDFISNRSNLEVLDAFVKSFDFSDMRIDEALRLYLETFRLPGESPLISLILEHFADHWHKSNGEPFANADAAFTLAYAVIMLNVDQHNHNVKRQNNPMTAEEFKKNLKKVNGGEDFDQDVLDEIYNAIKNEEIVMPAEQTGLVKENYLWKVLLRRGSGKDGVYLHAVDGLYDHDLFSLIWSPAIAALSYVFDKSTEASVYQKAVLGFRKCAMISAHYSTCTDFDNLIVSLCKFTNLLNSTEAPESATVTFGANPKGQLVAKTLFALVHRHGDIMRESWKNVLEIILQLHRCKLLPKSLIEAEDFLERNKKIILTKEEIPSQKTETGLLSSLYSYIALGAEASSHRTPSLEDQEHAKAARACVRECRIEQIVTESKFLRMDSLLELIKALVGASRGPGSSRYDEDATVFFLEILVKIVVQNSDRANAFWPDVRDHIYSLIAGASACNHYYLTERSVVGLLRLAIRLMRREEMSLIVLQSLRMLLLLKPAVLQRISRQIAYGLYELLKTSAANIHAGSDWTIIFTLLECVGAGAPPPRWVSPIPVQGNADQGAKSDGDWGSGNEDSGFGNDRGYTSDSEIQLRQKASQSTSPETSPNVGGGWILVGTEGDVQSPPTRGSQTNVARDQELLFHDPFALVKCCESLAFLVRDVAHITPFNFEYCVRCIRTFVEASLNGNEKKKTKKSNSNKDAKSKKKWTKKKEEKVRNPQLSPTPSAYDADESDSEELPSGYHQISIQLLDLMHTLHTRTAQIFRWWAEENADTSFTSLWAQGWCPLLQGIARLCCDSRKQVRMTAITYLQRALLVHDLQTLTADEWESCFDRVLFPLLGKLLELNFADEPHLEETRVRAATVLSKVFLHHLTPLLSLPTFTTLWLNILEFMNRYMHVERSDLLFEAIPESLKNMLLVMDSAQVFVGPEGYLPLWHVTWDRINGFLPGLKEEFFKAQSAVPKVDDVALVSRTEEPPTIPAAEPSPPLELVPAQNTDVPPPPMVTSTQSFNVPPTQTPNIVPLIQTTSIVSPPLSTPTQAPVTAAARSTSIILQPPSSSCGQTFSTPIFNHLGHRLITTTISGQPPPNPPPAPVVLSDSQQNIPLLVPGVSIPLEESTRSSIEDSVTELEGTGSATEVHDTLGTTDPQQPDAEDSFRNSIPSIGSQSSAFVPYVNLGSRPHPPSETLYIPPTSCITSPVQMYSTSAMEQEGDRAPGAKIEAPPGDVNFASVLSQYFLQQTQQPDAFDSLLSNSFVKKESEQES